MELDTVLRNVVDTERPCLGAASMKPVTSVIQQLMTRKNEPYLAVVVHADSLQCHLHRLHEYLVEEDYARYTANQQLRDGLGYHITVVNPAEFEWLVEAGTGVLHANLPVQYRLVGLGCAKFEGDTTYYVVCESEALQHFRASLGLGRKDFHVTLGFDESDVHDVAKDASTLIDPLPVMTK